MIHLNNLPDPSNTKHEVIQLKKTRILAVSLAAVFCAAGAGLLFLRPQSAVPTLPIPEPISKKQIYSTPNIDASQENSEIPATAEVNPQFVIREYQGHIGVFRNGNEYPFEVLEVEVSSFPIADQLLLANGISAESQSEVNRILEDYES